ncbi:ABC transporter substrate-binding protein (plasmid) [Nitratireductor sp. L1-7-SE]|uniref:ABC transporter substrate-binding protein n=1 Tax=Nitratireductor rhodophyticola TaxID=2854036 RepID=A0ABS7RD32_9HYPH|nr:ABC transporter substrate-binding protein [Nitratireductor rhodophyticola]MBY8918337.1 ABC transporter substrate-binding protein [Nitratireductor rhodophyticola]MBY8922680.1 ABC transporter substrate-binding protein [Nitratireductor rhodophyticola]MEC9243534.1 ABC transporter substrate-binding protein [Pseudomonadota bacterium]
MSRLQDRLKHLRNHARGVSLGLAAGAALMAGLGAATPALAQDKTITAVMHSGLRVLDPIITTAHITRNHGYMVYDVLVAVDENFAPQPQMADWTISDDNLTYTFTLRDGLKFHDGAPVTAADAVASLQRWGKRDSGGQLIFDVTESLEATDDKTIVWKLKSPFPALLDTVGKQSAVPPFIMPERVASGSADEAITDYTGSGPFVFVADEYQPGVSVTYRKFEDYVPRDGEASWMAGGKNVKVDEVKWVTMPDAQTAINALLSGEIDYIEQVQIDLLPLLETSEDVTVETRDDLGYQTIGRMNFKHPPFDNPKIRQAAQMALSQEAVLATLIGNPDYYKVCGAIFGCGTPLGDEAGSDTLTSGGDIEGAKKLLEEAGYDNTPIVLMQPTDVVSLTAQPVVAAQAMREAGFNVDMQAMDWQTLVTRRASQSKPSEGGWNIFFTNWMVPEINSPLISPMLNGRGDAAWFGWPEDEKVEELRAAFIAADTPEKQKEVAVEIQKHTLENVLYVPLGQYIMPQARSNKLTGMIPSPVPVFWNIEKAE